MGRPFVIVTIVSPAKTQDYKFLLKPGLSTLVFLQGILSSWATALSRTELTSS